MPTDDCILCTAQTAFTLSRVGQAKICFEHNPSAPECGGTVLVLVGADVGAYAFSVILNPLPTSYLNEVVAVACFSKLARTASVSRGRL
jgi:hypothetical protein